MSNGVALWGAITGTIGTLTGLGNLGRMSWRDRQNAKLDLEVTHGWQYVWGGEDGELLDVWVCVTLYNKGRRPLHVQYVGFETVAPANREAAELELGFAPAEDQPVWTVQRFEIALNGVSVEVAPDGPWVKIWTRLVPICLHAVDPTRQPVRAYAVTYNEKYWWSSPAQPLLPQPWPRWPTISATGEAVARLVLKEMGDDEMELSVSHENAVVGLQRLILDGDVLHVRELFPDDSPRSEPGDSSTAS